MHNANAQPVKAGVRRGAVFVVGSIRPVLRSRGVAPGRADLRGDGSEHAPGHSGGTDTADDPRQDTDRERTMVAGDDLRVVVHRLCIDGRGIRRCAGVAVVRLGFVLRVGDDETKCRLSAGEGGTRVGLS